MMHKTALLFSGGVDSASLAALLKPDLLIYVNYGQQCNAAELRAALSLSAVLNISLKEIHADCSEVGSGELAGSESIHPSPSPEWWPFRNQLLASLAGPAAIHARVTNLAFGTVSTDSFHLDGTQKFFKRLNLLMSMQEGGLHVIAPGIAKSSVQLVRETGLGMSYFGWTYSCHRSSVPCGECRGCVKRLGVLSEAGLW